LKSVIASEAKQSPAFHYKLFGIQHFFVGFPQASVGRFGKSAKKQLVAAKGFSFQSGLFESTKGII